MISPNTITELAGRERHRDGLRSTAGNSGTSIRTPGRPAGGRIRHATAVVLIGTVAVLATLIAAPGAFAHDVKLNFDVTRVSDRVSTGTVAGPISGSLRAEVRGRRPLAQQGARVTMEWKVRAGEHSFTARLRGAVNSRTRRAVLDGHVTSGFMAGTEVRLRGRVANRRSGRLVGTLTLVGHSARATASSCGHPCVLVSVIRYGQGRVTSSDGTPNVAIDCGTKCDAFIETLADKVVLTAHGDAFVGWRNCPTPAGNRCTFPVDATTHCIHAFFTTDQTAPPTAGACPVVAPPTPVIPPAPRDLTAPNTQIAAGPSGFTAKRTAVFRLRSTEAATFRCRLDAGAWTRCASIVRYRSLKPGRHILRVAAVDTSGNRDHTPALRRWRIAR